VGVFSTLTDAVVTVMEGAAVGMVKSPHLLRPQVTPSTGTSRAYSLDLQTVNTNKGRDRTSAWIVHRLSVVFVVKIKPNDVYTSQKEGLDLEEKVLAGLLDQSNMAAYAVFYEASTRTLNPSGELLYTTLLFRVEQSLAITS